MKNKYRIAALLAALLLMPIFAADAEEKADFTLEEHTLLAGMNRTWLQGYTPSISRDTLSLILPVKSPAAEGTVEAEVIIREDISPFKPQSMAVKAQRTEGGVWPLRFSLALYPDRTNGDYALTIRVKGKTKAGEGLQTEFPYTLRIRDGRPSEEAQRLEIQSVGADLRLGEEGSVTVSAANPCRAAIYERVSLRLSDPAGDVIPRDADEIFLPDLGPGEAWQASFPVTVLSKAAVAPHALKLEWNWVSLGQTQTQSASYTLPVRQEIRLEQGGLKMASSVIAGDSVTLSLPLMNLGKAEIVNVLATAELPGITDRQSVLVGNIGPGESRQAQITLTTEKTHLGDYSGRLTVTAADGDGNPASLSLPLHLTVEAPPPVREAQTPAEEGKAAFPLHYALMGGCGALALLLIIQGLVLRAKIHRLEEEKL